MRLKPYWISICESPVSSILFDVRQKQQQLFTKTNVQCVTIVTTYYSQMVLQRLVRAVAFTRHFLSVPRLFQYTVHSAQKQAQQYYSKRMLTVSVNMCLKLKLITTLIIVIKIKISVRKVTG